MERSFDRQNAAHVAGPVIRLTIVMLSVLVAIGMLILESTAGRGRCCSSNSTSLPTSETGL